MSEKHEPCPFCGCDTAWATLRYPEDSAARRMWQVYCSECHSGTPAAFEREDYAWDAWDRRPAPTTTQGDAP